MHFEKSIAARLVNKFSSVIYPIQSLLPPSQQSVTEHYTVTWTRLFTPYVFKNDLNYLSIHLLHIFKMSVFKMFCAFFTFLLHVLSIFISLILYTK